MSQSKRAVLTAVCQQLRQAAKYFFVLNASLLQWSLLRPQRRQGRLRKLPHPRPQLRRRHHYRLPREQ